ncbi:hypothetical protein B0T18DRAFT_179792 [Schizothecium vesticola]|uniref:Uncharacterized protein n=1 Tax=Schizothecium vesticola TaxID=314040 RepID=A0AA40K265_9PEZI|nr:hypothetical protein B0T18DRAFT_179792 [Schizothecium vesticola]
MQNPLLHALHATPHHNDQARLTQLVKCVVLIHKRAPASHVSGHAKVDSSSLSWAGVYFFLSPSLDLLLFLPRPICGPAPPLASYNHPLPYICRGQNCREVVARGKGSKINEDTSNAITGITVERKGGSLGICISHGLGLFSEKETSPSALNYISRSSSPMDAVSLFPLCRPHLNGLHPSAEEKSWPRRETHVLKAAVIYSDHTRKS